jgi:hypothetical protein
MNKKYVNLLVDLRKWMVFIERKSAGAKHGKVEG